MWEKHKHQTGFTIVELVIVIVVIGILAAITIITYNGITSRAIVATVSSDLKSAAKQLVIDQINSSAYPATISAANNGLGLKPSPGTTYQYTVDNSSNPQTFCITATNGTTSYFISSVNNVPTSGACSGQITGGIPSITNLAINPSAGSDMSNWFNWPGSGVVAQSRQTTGGFSGSSFVRLTWTTATTSATGGLITSASPVTPGSTYTSSMYYRANSTRPLQIEIKYIDSASNVLLYTGYVGATATTNWQRLSHTSTAPPNSVGMFISIISGGAPNFAIGDYIDGDAVMVTLGSTLYNYADGNSSNWLWNGAVNNSSSSGPPA